MKIEEEDWEGERKNECVREIGRETEKEIKENKDRLWQTKKIEKKRANLLTLRHYGVVQGSLAISIKTRLVGISSNKYLQKYIYKSDR